MAMTSDEELASRLMDEAGLSMRERYVIWARLLSEKPDTLEVVGRKFDVSRERIRQIEAKALRKILDKHVKDVEV